MESCERQESTPSYEHSLVHDIRELNKQLKISAQKIREVFRHNRNIIGGDESYAQKVYFTSEMITKRLDVYDFYRNRKSISTTERRYQLHRVLMKISKLLEDSANKKKNKDKPKPLPHRGKHIEQV